MTSKIFNSAFSQSYECSQNEKEKIEQLRKNVADLNLSENQLDDSFLIKWLRARCLDLPKAEEMLRASIKWRKENRIDTLLEEYTIPEDMKKLTPIAFCGVSKDGYATFTVPFGRHDMRTCLEKYGFEACEKFNNIFIENLIKIMEDAGNKDGIKKVTQIIEICDVEGYSYRQMGTKLCRDFMVKMQTSMDSNYPEILRYIMIVNTPKVFILLFNLFKPLLPKATLDKIDIYGAEPEIWKAIVKEKFPIEMIPPYWGGTLEGVDEYCSGHPIWIQGPQDMGACMKGLTEEDAAFQKVVVAARKRFVQEVDISQKGTILEWKFKSEGNDVGFQLWFSKEARAKKEDCEDIIPLSRVNAHTQVQDGSHLCRKEGIYSLVFDNRFSVFKAKTLLYQITFIDPVHQENLDA